MKPAETSPEKEESVPEETASGQLDLAEREFYSYIRREERQNEKIAR